MLEKYRKMLDIDGFFNSFFISGSSVTIVGNAPISKEMGRLIDSEPFVIRINNFIQGSVAGNRIDTHFLSTPLWEKMHSDVPVIIMEHHKGESHKIPASVQAKKNVFIVPYETVYRIREEIGIPETKHILTGIVACALFSSKNYNISVFGFDFFSSKDSYYFDDFDESSKNVHQNHDLDLERHYLERNNNITLYYSN